MKRRSASLDELWNEIAYAHEQRGIAVPHRMEGALARHSRAFVLEGGPIMTAVTCAVAKWIEGIRQLKRLAVSSPDPQIAAFARAFFQEHGREACKMVADIRRHRADVTELGAESFNLSDAELHREWGQR
jgi:hypothetical protein